jgi:hypothetical protein
VFVLLAGVNSPLMFPSPIGALEAQRRSAVDGRPTVFWRPGCKYWLRLRIRAANDGNETVPTVVVAGQPHTNPDPAWVRETALLFLNLPPAPCNAHGG